MESVDEGNSSERKEKITATLERITLMRSESEKLAIWMQQIEDTFKGFLTVTKSDLVNFLISDQRAELSAKQIQAIRNQHYEPLRHLTWITQQLKKAFMSNDQSRVSELQLEIKSIDLPFSSVAVDESDHRLFIPSAVSSRRAKKVQVKNDSQQLADSVVTKDANEGVKTDGK